MNVSVLGAGGWGTTLAILLNENGHNVTLWEYNPDYAETMRKFRENFYFLPKVNIPKSINITNDLLSAAESGELLVISTPTQFIRGSFESLKDFDFGNRIILNVSKGIEIGTMLLVNEIVEDIFIKVDPNNIAALSGPSHAEEVSRRIPTAVVCGSRDVGIAETVQRIFSNEYFRVYSSRDVVGVETGGALKNVIAIAAGISDGAGFGDNTKAAIMTRGISEIMRLGRTLGAEKDTFYGLSGIGDLIVTCASEHSRNRHVGIEIGKGRKLDDILSEMKMVAEGVSTAKSALELAKEKNVEIPIVEKVNKILFEGESPVEATKELMLRTLKAE
ncbi:MAG: NAD(P)-dependent glycerol-3-phosphate dehydrogenase [Ignavibacteriae bacterium]|nr:NAD(P)-dependent glycerol-3-phosphate dehydrogenase [Ignavibacteriota bacterium]